MTFFNLLPVYQRNFEAQQQQQQQQHQQQQQQQQQLHTPIKNLHYLRAIILTKRQKIVERRETLIRNIDDDKTSDDTVKFKRNVTIKTTLRTKTIAKLTI